MLDKIKKPKESGFTIVEVMIVLAIAGLVILIVFLAVPALQRNSRNAQRNNDIASIGGALAEYSSNTNGALPASNVVFHASVKPNVKLGFYDDSNTTTVQFIPQATPTAAAGPAATDVDTVDIVTNAKCNAAGTAAVAAGASRRSVVALYRVETGGGNMLQCREL